MMATRLLARAEVEVTLLDRNDFLILAAGCFQITRNARHERAITPTTDATPTTQRETP
jgi:hypothetical protein